MRKISLIFVLLLLAPAHNSLARQTTDDLIRSLQSRLVMAPGDYKTCAALGAAYVQKGRETGDATYYELARKALNQSLDLLSDDPDATFAKTEMALVCMAEHQFDEALQWAKDALALGSGNPAPWAIVVDALTDLGRYDEALAACSHLEDAKTPGGAAPAPVGSSYERDSRLSYLRFITGDTLGAIRLMQSAVRTAVEKRMPPENIAWSDYQLGEYFFRAGDLARAEKAYMAGLAADPGYYRDLAGLGEVRAAQEKYQQAIQLYRSAIAVIPYPMFAAVLADLYTKTGHPEEAKKQAQLIEFIGNLNPINRRLFYRELALFYADHDMKLKESVGLAEEELKVRQDVYTWDIYAWVLFKNGRCADAEGAMKRALRMGTEDALLLFHAGMIEARLGDSAGARQYLTRAVELNPGFSVLDAGMAQGALQALQAREATESRKQKAVGGRQ